MKRVVVIDDDQGVVSLLQKRLEANGYQVSSAEDGVKGLEIVRSTLPDLVILDIVMPGMDGFSLVREIRSDERLKRIPLIVITSKGEMGELFKAEGVGIILTKPFKMEDILQKVEGFLGKAD